MKGNKFKVWCKNKNEWEKDNIALYQDGSIYHTDLKGRHMYVSPEFHIIVFYTGLKDLQNVEAYHKDRVSALGGDWIIEWHENGWKLKQEDRENYQEIPSAFKIFGNKFEHK